MIPDRFSSSILLPRASAPLDNRLDRARHQQIVRVLARGPDRAAADGVAQLDRLDLDRHDELGHLVVRRRLRGGGAGAQASSEEVVEGAGYRHFFGGEILRCFWF